MAVAVIKGPRYIQLAPLIFNANSRITRVGETRGGNWGCHPSIFFRKKAGDLFLVASSAVSPLVSSSQRITTFFAHRCHYHYRFLANVNSSSCSLYVIVRPSVVCLLSVCNVRAPYSDHWNFRQCFYAIGTLTICWHPGKILRRSS